MTERRPKVLIVVNTNTFFTELFRVAQLLKNNGIWEPLLLIYDYPSSDRDKELCKAVNIDCILKLDFSNTEDGPNNLIKGNNVNSKGIVPDSKIKKILNMFKYMIKRIFFTQDIYAFLAIFQERSIVKMVLSSIEPALIILARDNVGYDSSWYIKLAHKKNKPVVIIPATMSNGLEEAEFHYHNIDQWCVGIFRNMVGRLYPNWVWKHRGRKLLRLLTGRILAMEWCGIAPPLPWISNSGFADVVALESDAMLKYSLDGGLPRSQLTVTGSLVDDILYRCRSLKTTKQEMIYEKISLPKGRPMLLSALPPDFLYVKGGRPECDFKDYESFVRTWCSSLAKVKSYNVVICLHPSVRYEEMKYIEDYGVKIAQENTAELVPVCDLYVTSVSSTIRWAIACGIPVINYDVYKYRYTDFMKVRGVLTFETLEEFNSSLDSMSFKSDRYRQIAAFQEAEASQWGRLDGQSGQRILALLDKMMQKAKG